MGVFVAVAYLCGNSTDICLTNTVFVNSVTFLLLQNQVAQERSINTEAAYENYYHPTEYDK